MSSGGRACAQARLARDVVGAAMAREHRVEPIAERVAQIADRRRGGGSSSSASRLPSPPHSAIRPPARSQTSSPADERLALVAAAPPGGDEAHQVRPARAIDREQHELRRRRVGAIGVVRAARATAVESRAAAARGFARFVRPRRPCDDAGVMSSVSRAPARARGRRARRDAGRRATVTGDAASRAPGGATVICAPHTRCTPSSFALTCARTIRRRRRDR